MADFAIANVNSDPLGLAGGAIVLVSVDGGPRKEYHESLNYNGKPLSDAVKELKPTDQKTVNYELHDTASLVIPLGILTNGWFVAGLTANCTAEGRPTVQVNIVKPSADAKYKARAAGAIELTFTGGFGVVDGFGATGMDTQGISSSLSISMQTAEAMHPTSGDYLDAGIFHYAYKKEVTVEAYAAPGLPAGAFKTSSDTKEGRDGWKTYALAFWSYLDADTLAP